MKTLTLMLVLSSVAFSYDRTEWIKASQWKVARRAILARDSVGSCKCWIDKYSTTRMDKAVKVDIDHIVPLSFASNRCGENFSSVTKHSFATDPINLVASSQTQNRSKGDKGILEWVPQVNQCYYYKHWYLVSKKYPLCLTKEELTVLNAHKDCKE